MQSIKRFSSCIVAAFGVAACVATASAASAPPQHIRGTIESVSANMLTVATVGGPVTVHLTPALKIAGVLPATADDIKPGTFIGAANVPGSGPARALEVVVFPNSMRGTGEGDYPWDLSAGGTGSAMTNGTAGMAHGSAMTNGTVGASHGSSMTNATVSHASSSGSTKTISVTYKGGTKQIAIPAGAPIVRLEPGTRALLVKGAHVFVIASPKAGSLSAMLVAAGENGTVPPM